MAFNAEGWAGIHRWQIDAKPKVSFQKLASKLREFLLSGSLKGMNIEQKGHKENRALAQTQTRPTPLKNLRVVAQPMRSAAYLIKSLSLWIVSFVFFGYYLHIVDFASALTSNFWTQWRNGEEDPTSGSKRLESPKVSSIIKEIFGSKGFPKMFSLVWRRNTSLLLWATTWYGKARWRLWHLRIWFCYLFFFYWHIVVAVVVDFGSWGFTPLFELFTDPLSFHLSNSCILKIKNNFWISQKRSDV